MTRSYIKIRKTIFRASDSLEGNIFSIEIIGMLATFIDFKAYIKQWFGEFKSFFLRFKIQVLTVINMYIRRQKNLNEIT